MTLRIVVLSLVMTGAGEQYTQRTIYGLWIKNSCFLLGGQQCVNSTPSNYGSTVAEGDSGNEGYRCFRHRNSCRTEADRSTQTKRRAVPLPCTTKKSQTCFDILYDCMSSHIVRSPHQTPKSFASFAPSFSPHKPTGPPGGSWVKLRSFSAKILFFAVLATWATWDAYCFSWKRGIPQPAQELGAGKSSHDKSMLA